MLIPKQGVCYHTARRPGSYTVTVPKYGFKLSDKATWDQRSGSGDGNVTINGTEADRRDITLWLMPALKIDDPELAVRVATSIVRLTQVKDAEGKGWGYAYLKQWLPDNFGIK